MIEKEIVEIENIEETLNELALSLKENVRSIRDINSRLRKLRTAVSKMESKYGKRPDSERQRLYNPLQATLNSLPLEERAAFLAEHMS